MAAGPNTVVVSATVVTMLSIGIPEDDEDETGG
jgi:hypothetical protein